MLGLEMRLSHLQLKLLVLNARRESLVSRLVDADLCFPEPVPHDSEPLLLCVCCRPSPLSHTPHTRQVTLQYLSKFRHSPLDQSLDIYRRSNPTATYPSSVWHLLFAQNTGPSFSVPCIQCPNRLPVERPLLWSAMWTTRLSCMHHGS